MAMFKTLPVLETPRLRLRRLELTDAPAIFAYASHPDMGKHTAWPAHTTLADSERFLERVLKSYEAPVEPLWGIEHREMGMVVGTCGLYHLEPAHGSGAIGYVLSPHCRGQGLMPEAARAVLAYGFGSLGLNRVQAQCRVDNGPSSRVLTKLGFQAEGVMRQCMWVKGQFIDMRLYALLREAFVAEGPPDTHPRA